MKKDPVDIVSATLEPTERCGALDQVKKDLIIVLIGRGASRREAAAYVKCHHTTIGRAAARDPKFASKLDQVEMAASLETGGMIRRAATEPKYWRAAAWMLERRNPEDYAKRAPHTFTADQVMSLLASVCSAALPTVQPDKIEEFHKFFDDAFDEVETKAALEGNARKAGAKEDKKDEECAPPARQNGYAVNGAPPSSNGHHPPHTPPAPEAAVLSPEPSMPPPEAASVRWPSEAVKDEVGTPSYEEQTAADDEFDQEFGTDDESDDEADDDLDIDWDRVDELHDAECRFVSADLVPDPEKRREADRFVRLALAAERLRCEPKTRPTHQPLDRVAEEFGDDLSCKALSDIELHRQTKSCTSGEKTKGRCRSSAETDGCEAVPAAAAAAVSG